MKNVLVNGAKGKMGKETVLAISACDDFNLVASLSKEDDLSAQIMLTKPDVVIDFTTPHCVYENTKIIIDAGIHPIIGTTGLTTDQIQSFQTICKEKQLGGLIAPNFSIAVALMLKYAKDCIKHLPQAEIIELHHDKKLDAPSGTALKTAEILGGDIPIHSVRLSGLLAHQAILFGSEGETLTIRQDTLDRKAFMAGVLLACHKVATLDHLAYGLEHIL